MCEPPFRLIPLFFPPETSSPCLHQIQEIQEISQTNPNNISLSLNAFPFSAINLMVQCLKRQDNKTFIIEDTVFVLVRN